METSNESSMGWELTQSLITEGGVAYASILPSKLQPMRDMDL